MHDRIGRGVDEWKVDDDSMDVEGLEEDGGPVVYIDGMRMHGVINRWILTERVTAALEGRKPVLPE